MACCLQTAWSCAARGPRPLARARPASLLEVLRRVVAPDSSPSVYGLDPESAGPSALALAGAAADIVGSAAARARARRTAAQIAALVEHLPDIASPPFVPVLLDRAAVLFLGCRFGRPGALPWPAHASWAGLRPPGAAATPGVDVDYVGRCLSCLAARLRDVVPEVIPAYCGPLALRLLRSLGLGAAARRYSPKFPVFGWMLRRCTALLPAWLAADPSRAEHLAAAAFLGATAWRSVYGLAVTTGHLSFIGPASSGPASLLCATWDAAHKTCRGTATRRVPRKAFIRLAWGWIFCAPCALEPGKVTGSFPDGHPQFALGLSS